MTETTPNAAIERDASDPFGLAEMEARLVAPNAALTKEDIALLQGTIRAERAYASDRAADLIEGLIAYRLATPSPDPAKGLEVVGYQRLNGLGGWMNVDPDDVAFYSGNRHQTIRALTDHATATRQIAERDARVAKTERDYSELRDSYDAVVRKLGIERENGAVQRARALAAEAEADAARVREENSEWREAHARVFKCASENLDRADQAESRLEKWAAAYDRLKNADRKDNVDAERKAARSELDRLAALTQRGA